MGVRSVRESILMVESRLEEARCCEVGSMARSMTPMPEDCCVLKGSLLKLSMLGFQSEMVLSMVETASRSVLVVILVMHSGRVRVS